MFGVCVVEHCGVQEDQQSAKVSALQVVGQALHIGCKLHWIQEQDGHWACQRSAIMESARKVGENEKIAKCIRTLLLCDS